MSPVFSTSYWPPATCFAAVGPSDSWVIEQHEHYCKQTFRTRCLIAGANGVLPLIVPVSRQHGTKTPIAEVLLDLSTPWQQMHWRALEAAYQNAPYFEYYQDDIRPFYTMAQPIPLLQYNTDILRTCLRLMEWNVPVQFTQDYQKTVARDYRQCMPQTTIKPYYQVFAQKYGFIAGLSILDLLMNEGPEWWKFLEPESDGSQNF